MKLAGVVLSWHYRNKISEQQYRRNIVQVISRRGIGRNNRGLSGKWRHAGVIHGAGEGTGEKRRRRKTRSDRQRNRTEGEEREGAEEVKRISEGIRPKRRPRSFE